MSEEEYYNEEYTCPDCNGAGWSVVAAHARDAECYADRHTNCPVQEQEACPTCGGNGEI